MRFFPVLLLATWALLFINDQSPASVTQYSNKAAWQAAVGNNYNTINFTGYQNGTFITNQYEGSGVIFSDGNDTIHLTASMVNDGAGLSGNDIIHTSFKQNEFWIGIDFPGMLYIELYYQGSLFFTSSVFGIGGTGFFGGLVSTTPFDAAVLIDPADEVEIDDLHFGPPIPAPGALAALATGFMLGCARRRRREDD